MNRRRNKKGTMLYLVGGVTTLLVALAAFFIWLMLVLGGNRETQNAVDAGSLNLAKQVLENPAVKLEKESRFEPLGQVRRDGVFVNLNNFNRLSAQVMLIQSNFCCMRSEGIEDPSARVCVDVLTKECGEIGINLAQQLAARANVIPYYESTANENSTRMLNACSINGDVRIYQSDYQTACSNRTGASNLRVRDQQFPTSMSPLWNTLRTRCAVDISDEKPDCAYLRGYLNDMDVGLGPLHFVPLKECNGSLSEIRSGHPHLISERTMNEDADLGRLVWRVPVPNAFGIKMNAGTKYIDPIASGASSSIVVSTRPSEGYYAQLPHGFIRIINAPAVNMSAFEDDACEEDRRDVLNFIKHSPVSFGRYGGKTLEKHFQHVGEPYVQNIVDANNNGRMPDPADMNALRKPASISDAKEMKSVGPTINNHTLLDNAKEVGSKEIADAFGKYWPHPAELRTRHDLHVWESALYQILAARSCGALSVTYDRTKVTHGSGLMIVEPPRKPVPLNAPDGGARQSGSTHISALKVATLAEVFKSGDQSKVLKRIKQRCYQILPTFNGSPGTEIVGWSDVKIPMGSTVYIYLDGGGVDPETGRPLGRLRVISKDQLMATKSPAWLYAERDATVDSRGKTTADCEVISVSPPADGCGLVMRGDWGYEIPYDTFEGDPAKFCVRNMVQFAPCTGTRDLLGEVHMSADLGTQGVDGYGTDGKYLIPGFTSVDVGNTSANKQTMGGRSASSSSGSGLPFVRELYSEGTYKGPS